MRQIRRNVFETNSSSTHSLTICTEDEFDRWKSGELMLDMWEDKFIEAIEPTAEDYEHAKTIYNSEKSVYYRDWDELSDYEKKQYTLSCMLNGTSGTESRYLSFDKWCDNYTRYCEDFRESFTTPSGDRMIAFGYYGYD